MPADGYPANSRDTLKKIVEVEPMSGKFKSLLLLAGMCAGSIASVGAVLADTGNGSSSFSLRGFGTVGAARSSSSHAEFVRDMSQPVGIKDGQWSGRIDSILGVQANWQATADVELVGQVVSRLHYDRSHNPEVMWAFAKWEPDPRFSLRAGRIGADFMILADSRLVGYSYLPVRPSPDFFGPLFFSHFDGADVSAAMPLGNGVLRGKVFGGWTQEKSAGALGVWDTSGSLLRGVVLEYVDGPWQFRGNLASIRFAADMNTAFLSDPLRIIGTPQSIAAAEILRFNNIVAQFMSIGIVYDQGPVLVQGMLNKISNMAQFVEESYAGYFLTGYRLGSITPYAGISWWRMQSKQPPITGLPELHPLNLAYMQFIEAIRTNRTTYSLGMRWDLRADMALKFQWDTVRATKDTLFSLRNVDPGWDGKTDVLSVTLDFIF